LSQTAAELYQSTVLEHNRSPRGYGDLLGATHSAEGFNPICGDRIKIQVLLDHAIVRETKFTAQSCALCRASASVMMEMMRGQSVAAALGLGRSLEDYIKGDCAPTAGLAASPAAAFFAIKDFPARAKCVLLPWRTFLSSLTDQSVVSTESKE
jgi:nitrogen fixation NifU-like protein